VKKAYNLLFKTFFTILLLVLGVSTLFADSVIPGGKITGHVTTSDGKSAEFVSVAIIQLNKAAVTNSDGVYTLHNVKAGNYTLKVSFVGLTTIEKQITVVSGKTITENFVLTENAAKLNEITINAHKTLNSATVNLGKADIAYFDLPQSGGVVTTQMLQDQQINHLGDAIRNVSGVTLTQTRGGVGETYTARGYSTGITGGASSVFRDGVLVNSAGFPEASTLASVEVLKGSSALLYGNVSGGLIINMVTKKPQFNYGGQVSMRYGSYNMVKPSVDVYGPISKNLAFRVIGVYENDGSYRNHVYTERKFINPSLLYNIGKKTSILLQTDFMKESLTPDFGIGSINNGLAIPTMVPRSQFINTSWAYSHMKQYSGTLNIKHKFNTDLDLNFITSAQSTNIDAYQASLPNAVSANGDWYRGVARAKTTENDYTAQLNLNSNITTGSIAHKILLGTDFSAVINFSNTFNFTGLNAISGVNYGVYDQINTIDLSKFTPRTDIPDATATIETKAPSYRFGYYVQDMIGITDKFKVLAGLRYSIQKTEQTYLTDVATQIVSRPDKVVGSATKFDRAFSPKIALIYQPTDKTSIYADYSNNFATNTGINVATGQAMTPSVIDQYDAGIKNELFDGKLSANLAVYRIVNSNTPTTSPFIDNIGTPNASNSNTYKIFTGETTSDGIELDINGNLSKNFYFIAGYGYNFMRYTKTAGTKGSNVEGEQVVINPRNTANASIFYTFTSSPLKGIKIGSSVFYTGSRLGGYNNTWTQAQETDPHTTTNRLLPIGGFVTLDLSAGYTYKKLSLLGAVTNVTNTMNYLIHDNYSITPIAPTQFITTLSYKF
jgi:iron complex outermembrane recepter protein